MIQQAVSKQIPSGRKKYVFTPFQDDLIRKIYREQYNPHEGRVKKLAEHLMIPRWRVTRRAREIGALEPRIKEPPWSDQEIHILELNALYTPEVIRRKLKKYGFERSTIAIMMKRKRLNIAQQQIKCSARAVAECFGVEAKAVVRWIDRGLLAAKRRGTSRTPQQGGDEWFIREKDMRAFIINNVGIIDFRKVDKFWLVNVLAEGRYAET